MSTTARNLEHDASPVVETGMESQMSVILAQAYHYMLQAFSSFWTKLGLGAVFAILATHQTAITAVGVLCLLDFVLGVVIAFRVKALSSARMRRGAVKLLLYAILVLTVALLEGHFLPWTDNKVTLGVLGLLAATEVLSIIENLLALGLPVPFSKQILGFLADKGRNVGLSLDSNVADALMASDLNTLLQGPIPRLRDAHLRALLRTWCTTWFTIMREVSASFDGDANLVWERVSNGLGSFDARFAVAAKEAGVPQAYVTALGTRWADEITDDFFDRVLRCTREKTGASDRVQEFASALTTLLYRCVNNAPHWDEQLAEGVAPKDVQLLSQEDSTTARMATLRASRLPGSSQQ